MLNQLESPLYRTFQDSFDFILPKQAFVDLDVLQVRQTVDEIKYQIRQKSGSPLPAWLTYSTQSNVLSGSPVDLTTIEPYCAGPGMSVRDQGLFAQNWLSQPIVPIHERTCLLQLEVYIADGYHWIVGALDILYQNRAPHQFKPVFTNGTGLEQVYNTHVYTVWDFQIDTLTFQDLDANRLTFQSSLENGDTLPIWLIFVNQDRRFIGKPTKSEIGLMKINVTVSDGIDFFLGQFTINIYNRAPEVIGVVKNYTLDFDQQLKIFIINQEFQFHDPDGDPLSFIAECQPVIGD